MAHRFRLGNATLNLILLATMFAWIVCVNECATAQVFPVKISQVAELKIHDRSVASAAFSPTGELIATSSIDQTVLVTDWRTGKTLVTLKGFSPGDEGTWDRTVLFLKDGRRLLTANSAASIELWDWRAEKRLWKQETGARSLACSPDEKLLLSADWEQASVQVWDLATGKLLDSLNGIEVPIEKEGWSQGNVAYAPSGKLFASAIGGTRDESATNVTITIWNAATRKAVTQWSPIDKRTHGLAWSPSGEQLAGAGTEGTVFVVRFPQPKSVEAVDGAKLKALLEQLDDEDFAIRKRAHQELESQAAAFQPELEHVLTKKISEEVRWRVEDVLKKAGRIEVETVFLPQEHPGTIMDIAFSPDSKLLAAVSRVYQENRGRLVIWDANETKKPVFTWDGPGMTSVSFSRDGKSLVASSQDGTVRIWKLEPVVEKE
jgi:WD40 repeat protein